MLLPNYIKHFGLNVVFGEAIYLIKVTSMKKIKLTKEQIERLAPKLNEMEGVKGGINRVNNQFKKEFKVKKRFPIFLIEFIKSLSS